MLNSEKPFGNGDVMEMKRFCPEQIIVKLREAEIIESKGLTQVEPAKKPGICEQMLIRWRKKHGG
jgi:putative transposase